MKATHIIILILSVVIIVLLLSRPTTVVETITYVSDTIYLPDTVLVPVHVWHTPIPKIIDTLAVIQDYFNKKEYSQRLNLDTLGYVDVRFNLEQNRLMGLNYNYNLSIPTLVRYNQYKNQISIQRSIIYNTYQVNYQRNINKRFTINTSITTNQDLLVGIGFKF